MIKFNEVKIDNETTFKELRVGAVFKIKASVGRNDYFLLCENGKIVSLTTYEVFNEISELSYIYNLTEDNKVETFDADINVKPTALPW